MNKLFNLFSRKSIDYKKDGIGSWYFIDILIYLMNHIILIHTNILMAVFQTYPNDRAYDPELEKLIQNNKTINSKTERQNI